MIGIEVCRTCGEDYVPRDEHDDICYACSIAPVEEGLQNGEYECVNCGAYYTYSPAAPIGACSAACAPWAFRRLIKRALDS